MPELRFGDTTDNTAGAPSSKPEQGSHALLLEECFQLSPAKPAENVLRQQVQPSVLDLVAADKIADKPKTPEASEQPAKVKPENERTQQLQTWVKNLAADDFRTRETASRQLKAAGVEALPHLKDVLTKPNQDPEAIRRAKALVDERIQNFPTVSAKQWLASVTDPRRNTRFDIEDPPETLDAKSIPEAARKAKTEEAIILHDLLSNSSHFEEAKKGLFASLKDEYKGGCADAAKVTTLSLGQSQLTDTGLQRLRGCTNLEGLYIHNTEITDAGMAHIASFANLKVLSLDSTGVTDEGVKKITNRKLEVLTLFGVRGVSNDSMEAVGKLSELRTLALNSTSVTDDGLAPLKGLTKLNKLLLENTGITDNGLKHLSGMKSIVYLQINMTDITDDGIKHLAGLTNLEVIDLPRRTTNASLEHLKGANKLKELSIDDAQIDDAGLANLKNFPRLEKLFIYKSPGITNKGLLSDIQALPNLKTVSLQETQIDRVGVIAFEKKRPTVDITAMAVINGVLRDIR
jgi:Leucine-rich repeat (LRR) protein